MNLIQRLEPYFKWLCLLLFAMIVYMGAYNWRDDTLNRKTQQLTEAAVIVAQLNNMISPTGETQINIINQVNRNLINWGFPKLARQSQPAPAVVDSVVAKTKLEADK